MPCLQSRVWHKRGVHWLLWLFYWLYWLAGLKRRWLAMTLTVTRTPVLQVGRSFDVYEQYNYYRHCDFPGPGPVWSFLLGWSNGLTYLTCSKSSNVVWAVLHEMLKFRTIFLNESSIAIRCQWLFNEGQPNTLTCVLVQQTSWSSWCLQIRSDCILPRGAPCMDNGWSSPTSDILPQEACHEYCYDLRWRLRSVRTELKSTVWNNLVAMLLGARLSSVHTHDFNMLLPSFSLYRRSFASFSSLSCARGLSECNWMGNFGLAYSSGSAKVLQKLLHPPCIP